MKNTITDLTFDDFEYYILPTLTNWHNYFINEYKPRSNIFLRNGGDQDFFIFTKNYINFRQSKNKKDYEHIKSLQEHCQMLSKQLYNDYVK